MTADEPLKSTESEFLTNIDVDRTPPTADNSRKNFLVREAVLLALVPGLGYGVAYAFAVGRATKFGIPDQLISVSTADVLRSVSAIVAPIGLIYVLVANFFSMVPASKLKHLREPFGPPLTMLIFACVFLKAGQFKWIWWIIVLLGITLVFFILPIAITKVVRHLFRQRIEKAATTEASSRPNAFAAFLDWFGIPSMIVVVVVVLVLLLSDIAGYGSASNQAVFFEAKGSQNVLLAVDGANLVFGTVSHNRLTGKLTLVANDVSNPLVLVPVQIGPLKTPKNCLYQSC
jgi:hypothetical protein